MMEYVTKPRKLGRTATLKAMEQCRCGEEPPGWGTDKCPCMGCWMGERTVNGVGCCPKWLEKDNGDTNDDHVSSPIGPRP